MEDDYAMQWDAMSCHDVGCGHVCTGVHVRDVPCRTEEHCVDVQCAWCVRHVARGVRCVMCDDVQ
jgi:hypothetical protein